MVNAKGKVELRTIRTGLDFGNELEVLSGLAPSEKVIVNPPDSIAAGQKVRIAEPSESAVPQ